MNIAIGLHPVNDVRLSVSNADAKIKEEDSNWFSDWLDDKDKVCTDNKDDGSISLSEAAESFGKGLMGLVKAVVNHPVKTLAGIAAGAAITALTGGAAVPVFIALGCVTGAGMIGYGVYNAVTAETDAEAKQAWETIGSGTFALGASVLGSKSALKCAGKAGVKSALGSEGMTYKEATMQCFKSLPESIKVSGTNIVQNSKVLLGLSKPQIPDSKQIYEMEKRAIENKYYRDMKKASEGSFGKLMKRYADPNYQKRAMDLINQDNIELAKKLYAFEESGKTSDYLVFRERYCQYYNETIPKILKSNNPEMQQLALDILADDAISCKAEALSCLTSRNTNSVRETLYVGMEKPYKYNSITQLEKIRPPFLESEPNHISFSTNNDSGYYTIKNTYGDVCMTLEEPGYCNDYRISRLPEVRNAQIQSENAKVAELLSSAKNVSSNNEINGLLQLRAKQVEQINSLRLSYRLKDLQVLQQTTHNEVAQEISMGGLQTLEELNNAYAETARQINDIVLKIKDVTIW
ncbi:MAG: hypothetical protein NC408_09555 [Candidatus Gastranaerophilales bacterium]|nr:hypothetical protein [Candidatus Gastranaerophilales bacterium]